jgi:hypothetical protein
MRCLAGAIALCAFLLVAKPAFADYSRLAAGRPDDDVAVVGDAVAVGATADGGSSTLALYGLDGTVRPIALPKPARFVEELQASATALAVITLSQTGGEQIAYFGASGGPLRRLPRTLIDVAVTGDIVVSLHRRSHDRGRLELRNTRTGRLRRVDVVGTRVAIVTAAGRYAAYAVNFASGREATVVVDSTTGRERYRVRTPRGSTAYGLAPDGRLWFAVSGRRSGRIVTATPTHPRPRTVVRLRAQPYELAVAAGEIAVFRAAGVGSGNVVLVRPDGRVRVVTPNLPSIGALAYDGSTLAFATGVCVFAGPLTDAPQPLVLDGCSG